MMDARTKILGALSAILILGLAGCGLPESDEGCTSPEILPHQSPAALGVMYPTGNNDPDPAGNLRTPYQWVLPLQSECSEPVEIQEVCLVGDDSATQQFTLETESEDLPASVDGNDDYAVRLTYDRQNPNGGGNADQVGVVVQSNSTNFPTLVVPVCAQVVADGEDRGTVECEPPVEVPEGTKDETLCQ
jgi:hypothetical protein